MRGASLRAGTPSSLTIPTGRRPLSSTRPRSPTAAQMVQPNRIVQTIRPVKVSESSPGVYLIDMGRNFTGWFELRIPAGARRSSGVKLEYADFAIVETAALQRTTSAMR